jgi:uncharacterized protein YprB with RNaseH-like and TPR domain
LKGRISRLKSLGLVKASELGAASTAAEVAAAAPTSAAAPASAAASAEGAARGRLARRERVPTPERGEFLPGWERIDPHVFRRTAATGFSLGAVQPAIFHPGYFESHVLSARRAAFREPAPGFPGVPLEGLSFFDLETTGLSGGTGTIAFLAAVGYFEGADFLTTQVFIDDFPGEPRFLELLAELLGRRPHVVTYNGAAFDMPLLRTRCIMNAVQLPELAHTDALKAARRLWRRTLGSCALQAIESSVLGERRAGDIPGFMIPALWLEYSAAAAGARDSETLESMARIAEHNALDVVSLARIFLRVERIMAEPERRWATDKVHAPRLASELVAQGREAEGLAILEASGAEGDQASLLLLSRMRRRRREFDAYERAVLALDGESLLGLVERAKLYEHRKRDYGRALECAERAERMLLEGGGEISDGRIPRREEALESLARRLERLRLKLEIAAGDR